MSPIFLTLCLLAVITLIAYWATSLIKTERNKKENLFLHLSQEGAINNLIFCSQEMLQHKVIGIDGIHRKIMIVEEIDRKYNVSILCLDEVRSCQMKKNYAPVNMGAHKKFGSEKVLHTIVLQFEFKNASQPVSITFYNSEINSKKEIGITGAKAEYWSIMLSKMLTGKQLKTKATAA